MKILRYENLVVFAKNCISQHLNFVIETQMHFHSILTFCDIQDKKSGVVHRGWTAEKKILNIFKELLLGIRNEVWNIHHIKMTFSLGMFYDFDDLVSCSFINTTFLFCDLLSSSFCRKYTHAVILLNLNILV